MVAASQAVSTQPNIDLATLREMNYRQLDHLYRESRAPESVSELDGDARGAMLAWRRPASGPIAALLRSFGKSSGFPWEGKSFQSTSGEGGTGINRINLVRNMRWFPFQTRLGPSFRDGKPTFVLDYSGRANPPLIRSIVDEVREVAPGLYMGPAAIIFRGQPRPVLFFALSFPNRER